MANELRANDYIDNLNEDAAAMNAHIPQEIMINTVVINDTNTQDMGRAFLRATEAPDNPKDRFQAFQQSLKNQKEQSLKNQKEELQKAQAALRDWKALRAEKYPQIRRYIAILGFTQGETDAEACTIWTRDGTTSWEYVLINADTNNCGCVGIDFDNIIKEADAAEKAEAEVAEKESVVPSLSQLSAARPIATSPYVNINEQTNVDRLVAIQIAKEKEEEKEEASLTLKSIKNFFLTS